MRGGGPHPPLKWVGGHLHLFSWGLRVQGDPLATPLSLHHLGGVQVCFIMHDLSPVLMGSQSPGGSSGHVL